MGIRSGLWLVKNKNEKCSKPQAAYSFTPKDRIKFCQFIKGVKLPDGFGSNFKHKVTDNDTNITGLKSHDCHIMMQRLLPYGHQQYLPSDIAKPLIELCLFFKQICSQTLMVDDMLKAQSKVIYILCNLELIYPPAFFDIVIHLVIHLPLEAIFDGPIRPRPKIDTYRAKFKSEFPNKDMKEEFPGWFRKQNDLGVSKRSELFSLACGPSQTLISVNSCVVNGVKFVVHSRDKRRTTQNSSIFSLGPDGEMYYDVDAPPDIIDVVDEDDDIIDEEDPVPHDLADSDDDDLVNLDIDDGVNMSVDVARGHDGDGGGDDRPLPYEVPTSCGGCLGNRGKGTRKPNLGGRRASRLHTRQETQNLGLKAITDKSGPVLIRTLLGAKCHRTERRGSWQRLGPSLTCVPTWNPIAGHKSMQPSSSSCKSSTMARRLLSRKGIGFLKRMGLTTWSASDPDVPHTFSR
uniref:DUF4218 domain-containing protein n=1 Tax=Tanacetum cinerariifolium TaxID=118510 RepID=A0A699HBA8_TANCI|nr:hypothetical protein [Tanacetum cinerariifolium]